MEANAVRRLISVTSLGTGGLNDRVNAFQRTFDRVLISASPSSFSSRGSANVLRSLTAPAHVPNGQL
jgi:hypothetical protein